MRAIDYRLYSRNQYLYYRYILPQKLRPAFPYREIKISLGTQDIALARLYVAKLDIELQTLLDQSYEKLRGAGSAQEAQRVQARMLEGIEAAKVKAGLSQRQSLNMGLLSAQDRGKEKPFSKVAKEYLADCLSNSPKTIEHKRQTYEIFQSMLGDLPFNTISKVEARKFKEVMVKTPANLTKLGKLKTYFEVDWRNLPDRKPQSHVTVNNRLINMSALFTWAERNDLYEGKNPFMGLFIDKAKTNAVKRPPFSKEQLQTLFACPIYTGCKGQQPRYRMEEGKLIIKDYKYWIPLVGVYTGMRLNEICQLLVEDVQCIDGIWAINLDDSNQKQLKNASSRRKMPIHTKLIELGFLEYVEEQGAGRLFKSLPQSGQGSYGTVKNYRYSNGYHKFNRDKTANHFADIMPAQQQTGGDKFSPACAAKSIEKASDEP